MDIKVNKDTVVVFDLDDTLYNEIDFLKSAYRNIAQNITPESWRKLFAQMFAMYRSGENVFEFLIQKFHCSQQELLKGYRFHDPDITPFPGVIDLFQKIKDHQGKIAIVTDGRSITQRNKIKALGLESLVDLQIISEEIGSEKPNPKNFLAVTEYFNKSTYFYIADNVRKDFDAPKSLGWGCVLVTDNGLNIHVNQNVQEKINDLNLDVLLHISELRVI